MRLIHRLIRMRYGIRSDSVLNWALPKGDTTTVEPFERAVIALKSEAFASRAGRVDYSRLRGSATHADYQRSAAALRAFDPATLTDRAERLAFWINLYNALIVDAVIQFGIQRSVHERPGFFWRAAYEIGGRRYDATDIEYGVLRANRGHPAIPGPHFGADDPRRAHSLTSLDPRIHFALVCAARSCPPIAVYDPATIDAQLVLAARAFIRGGGVEIDRPRGEVRLSKIFQWYAPDFGGRPFGLGDRTPLLRYVAPFLADREGRDYLLSSQPRVRFLPYDWSLNAVRILTSPVSVR